MKTDKHLTLDQFAARLGVPKKTIYDWNSRGLSPRRIRVGRHVRYRLADVLAWEKKREVDEPL